MVFEKNKKYFSCLREEKEGHWVCENPLFICGDKGLYPIYRANGRYGVLNKHYHELTLRDIDKETLKWLGKAGKPGNKGAENILKFRGGNDELLKGL
jgi:hypothetical protein